MKRLRLKSLIILAGVLPLALRTAFPQTAAAPEVALPKGGPQSRASRYHASLTSLFAVDFESPWRQIVLTSGKVTESVGGAALSGNTSLRLEGTSWLLLNQASLPLQAGRIYILEYDYRLERQPTGPGDVQLLSGFMTGKGDFIYLGSSTSFNGVSGHESRRIRVGPSLGQFVIFTADATATVDNLRVYREDSLLTRSELPLTKALFPRLINYNLGSPEGTAFRTGAPLSQIDHVLAGYDVLTGLQSEYLVGDGAWPERLKALNPSLRILPYVNAFMAQYLDRKPQGEAGGLLPLFNQGLYSDWFMRSPSGDYLISPDFPSNVEMNHTDFCPPHDGIRFRDYMQSFVTDAVLPSGLWDGIHFDQPEWYPNPTLVPRTQDGQLPPIDLRGDGSAAPLDLLHSAWSAGYTEFFRGLYAKLGFSQLILNNAGYIPRNTQMLATANGWLREMASPYATRPNGDWETNETGGWYRLVDNYLIARQNARAPQVLAMEFSGYGLGKPSGTLTANGFPDRVPELEPRDYQRMRLGLTTTLLSDGFFEYDFIDNTTVPLWFDEFAVDSSGTATTDYSGKGYLGQPLGAAVELSRPGRVVSKLDFESQEGVGAIFPGSDFSITTDPALVLGGRESMVCERRTLSDLGIAFFTTPASLPFEIGKTYTISFDFRVVDYQPTTYRGLFGLTVSGGDNVLQVNRGASLYLPDMEGPGQRGSLRTAVKITQPGTALLAGLSDTGRVVVDNILVQEDGGGVWRRDFENGIVLVNPMPDTITLQLEDIAGPLRRTSIRAIRGRQVPEWNHGGPIDGPLSIPPGDGIILLADPIAAPPPVTPDAVHVEAAGANTATIQWSPAPGTVEGYRLWYGLDPNSLTQEAAAAGPSITLTDLDPRAHYYSQVATYDYRGRSSAPSGVIDWTTSGPENLRPQLRASATGPLLTPGAVVALEGSNLAPPKSGNPDSTVLAVDGVTVKVTSAKPGRVEFVAPWMISGETATVKVTVNGVSSADVVLPVSDADPMLLDASSAGGGVFHEDRQQAVNAANPAASGDVIFLRARGMGEVEPPPVDGSPRDGVVRNCAHSPVATIGGRAASTVSCAMAADLLGLYWLGIRVPEGVAAGEQPIRVSVAGRESNSIAGVFR